MWLFAWCISLLPHFFTVENENFDEVFSAVTICQMIRGGFFCKVNQLIFHKIEDVMLLNYRILYLRCFHVVFFFLSKQQNKWKSINFTWSSKINTSLFQGIKQKIIRKNDCYDARVAKWYSFIISYKNRRTCIWVCCALLFRKRKTTVPCYILNLVVIVTNFWLLNEISSYFLIF